MKVKEYETAAAATNNRDVQPVFGRIISSDKHVDLLNGGLGIAGEAGEVADHIKKHFFHGARLDRDKIIKECGDTLWYIAQVLNAVNSSVEEAMKLNIEKLRKRYPDGHFTEKDAQLQRDGDT